MSDAKREEENNEITPGKYLRFWYRHFNTFLLGKVEQVCFKDGTKKITILCGFPEEWPELDASELLQLEVFDETEFFRRVNLLSRNLVYLMRRM